MPHQEFGYNWIRSFINLCLLYFGYNVKEELISLTLITTKEIGIYNVVLIALTDRVIDLLKVVLATTERAQSLTGEENGFVSLFKMYSRFTFVSVLDSLSYYCFTHHQFHERRLVSSHLKML